MAVCVPNRSGGWGRDWTKEYSNLRRSPAGTVVHACKGCVVMCVCVRTRVRAVRGYGSGERERDRENLCIHIYVNVCVEKKRENGDRAKEGKREGERVCEFVCVRALTKE